MGSTPPATKPSGEVGLTIGFGPASYGSARQPSHEATRRGLRLGAPDWERSENKLALARLSMGFYYVYILQPEKHTEHFYAGFTEDLDARLKAHNAGQVPHTSKYRPWTIKTAIAFSDREQALAFETYLKTPSGRAVLDGGSDLCQEDYRPIFVCRTDVLDSFQAKCMIEQRGGHIGYPPWFGHRRE
jgi:putative endonuclease